eukprot:1146258-Pelagomonas_calceolata.AAC.3
MAERSWRNQMEEWHFLGKTQQVIAPTGLDPKAMESEKQWRGRLLPATPCGGVSSLHLALSVYGVSGGMCTHEATAAGAAAGAPVRGVGGKPSTHRFMQQSGTTGVGWQGKGKLARMYS